MDLRGKKILVLGLHRQGVEAVKALLVLGAKPVAFDLGENFSAMERIKQELASCQKQIHFGPEIPQAIFDVQQLVLAGPKENYRAILDSPALKNVSVLSPLDLALQYSHLPVIAITGTNGKSSTAKLTELMLSHSGKKVFLGGGTFDSFPKIISSKQNFDLVVLELSSTVLQESQPIKPQIAILTNLVPHHFERHATVSEYFATKAKIFLAQTAREFLIYNAENPYAVELVAQAQSHRFPIYLSDPKSSSKEIQEYAYYEKKKLYFCRSGQEIEVYSTVKMKVTGPHQMANALCALSAARLMGAAPISVQMGLENFQGLPHRMSKCFEKEGLIFYDDTSAWNPAATAWGLMSFQKPVILIAGGIYRGADYAKLYPYVQKKVRLLILIGEARRKIHQSLKDATETFLVSSLEEAVQLAIAKSQLGDAIVFSPAAPPEPYLYEGYDGRGENFLEILKRYYAVDLEQKRRGDTLHREGIKI